MSEQALRQLSMWLGAGRDQEGLRRATLLAPAQGLRFCFAEKASGICFKLVCFNGGEVRGMGGGEEEAGFPSPASQSLGLSSPM